MLTGTFIWIIIVIIFPPYVVHYAKIDCDRGRNFIPNVFYSHFMEARMWLLQSEFRIELICFIIEIWSKKQAPFFKNLLCFFHKYSLQILHWKFRHCVTFNFLSFLHSGLQQGLQIFTTPHLSAHDAVHWCIILKRRPERMVWKPHSFVRFCVSARWSFSFGNGGYIQLIYLVAQSMYVCSL